MSNLRAAAQQALEALTNCGSEYGHRCTRCDSEIDEGGKVAADLRAALEQEAEVPLVVGCGGNNTTGSLPQAQENLSVFSDVTLEDGSRWIVTVFGGGGSGTREKNT